MNKVGFDNEKYLNEQTGGSLSEQKSLKINSTWNSVGNCSLIIMLQGFYPVLIPM